MFDQLIQYNNVGVLVLRFAVAIIFIYHALPKLQNSKGMARMVGMASGMVFMLGLVELIASIGITVGFYTQLAALLLAIIMVGAIGMKTMKWHVSFAATDKTGWEFDFILFAASVVILLGGGGTIGIQ